MGKKRKKSGDSSEEKPTFVVQLDEDNGDEGLTGDEAFDLSQIGTPISFEDSSETYLSASDILKRDFSNLPSEILQSRLSDIEPLDPAEIGASFVLDESIGNAWDAIKENQSFQETLKNISLQDDLQLEKDYWKTLLEDDTSKFNITLKSMPSFQDWVDDNRESLNVDWDTLLKGSKSLDLDSLASATATAARYIHFFDDLDEDKRYLTLRDDGVLWLPDVEPVEVDEEPDVEEPDDETTEEVVELRPHLAALSKQTQPLPSGLLRVAIADTESSIEQYGLQIGDLPEAAARTVLQCIVDERVKQDSDSLKWRLGLLAAVAVVVAAIIAVF